MTQEEHLDFSHHQASNSVGDQVNDDSTTNSKNIIVNSNHQVAGHSMNCDDSESIALTTLVEKESSNISAVDVEQKIQDFIIVIDNSPSAENNIDNSLIDSRKADINRKEVKIEEIPVPIVEQSVPNMTVVTQQKNNNENLRDIKIKLENVEKDNIPNTVVTAESNNLTNNNDCEQIVNKNCTNNNNNNNNNNNSNNKISDNSSYKTNPTSDNVTQNQTMVVQSNLESQTLTNPSEIVSNSKIISKNASSDLNTNKTETITVEKLDKSSANSSNKLKRTADGIRKSRKPGVKLDDHIARLNALRADISNALKEVKAVLNQHEVPPENVVEKKTDTVQEITDEEQTKQSVPLRFVNKVKVVKEFENDDKEVAESAKQPEIKAENDLAKKSDETTVQENSISKLTTKLNAEIATPVSGDHQKNTVALEIVPKPSSTDSCPVNNLGKDNSAALLDPHIKATKLVTEKTEQEPTKLNESTPKTEIKSEIHICVDQKINFVDKEKETPSQNDSQANEQTIKNQVNSNNSSTANKSENLKVNETPSNDLLKNSKCIEDELLKTVSSIPVVVQSEKIIGNTIQYIENVEDAEKLVKTNAEKLSENLENLNTEPLKTLTNAEENLENLKTEPNLESTAAPLQAIPLQVLSESKGEVPTPVLDENSNRIDEGSTLKGNVQLSSENIAKIGEECTKGYVPKLDDTIKDKESSTTDSSSQEHGSENESKSAELNSENQQEPSTANECTGSESQDVSPSEKVEGEETPSTEEKKPKKKESKAKSAKKLKMKKKIVIKRVKRRLSIGAIDEKVEPEICEKEVEPIIDDPEDDEEDEEPGFVLKPIIKVRAYEPGDLVMYADRIKKTVKWKKATVIERITSISYKLNVDGQEKPAHISYIKKYTDKKVQFGGKEYLEIDYAQEDEEEEEKAPPVYNIWARV